jgi:hypothetical protein
MMALRDNIKRYEDSFGNIQDIDGGVPPFPMGFSGPTGQA